MPHPIRRLWVAGLLLGASASAAPPFYIKVVDDQTGRGVPLVELKTVDEVRYYTDSAGIAVIDDPVFSGRDVFFYVSGDGYVFPPDPMGIHGETATVRPGGSMVLKVHRMNIAERLYRLTGEGIYRDSVLAGLKVPIAQPLLDAEVVGQDGCIAAVYRNRIYWFFGDTARLSYALGQFGTSGAVSSLPGQGGLDPSVGVDLHYFTGSDGFSRRMFPQFDAGLAWLDGLTVVPDKTGRERMIAVCSNMKTLDVAYGRYLEEYNDADERFDTVKQIPEGSLRPHGRGSIATDGGVAYVYYGRPYPNVRVKADLDDILDPSKYEAFTCLVPGTHFSTDNLAGWIAAPVDRDAKGSVVWAWKRDTAQVDDDQLQALVRSQKLSEDEAWFWPHSIESDKYVDLHSGDVSFNRYRKKWIMIGQEVHGNPSFGGEIWYLEADRPEGPWKWARKILTHDHTSFYNPVLHPFFDQQGGRFVYFEGTYSFFFSGSEAAATPRYDYNQIMYRLDLADPRLTLTPPQLPPG